MDQERKAVCQRPFAIQSTAQIQRVRAKNASQLTVYARLDLFPEPNVGEQSVVDSAANGNHGKAAVLDLCELVVSFSVWFLGKPEGINSKVPRVFAVLLIDLLVCGGLAYGHEKENLEAREEADAGYGVQRIGDAIGGVREVVDHFGEDPADHGKHTNTAC